MGIIAVGADPLASRFDSESGKVRVRDEIRLCSHSTAEIRKDWPMSAPWRDHYAEWLREKALNELKGYCDGSGRSVNTRISHDSEEPTADLMGDSERFITVYDVVQPGSIPAMFRRLSNKCVDKDVNVGKDHLPDPSTQGDPQSRRY